MILSSYKGFLKTLLELLKLTDCEQKFFFCIPQFILIVVNSDIEKVVFLVAISIIICHKVTSSIINSLLKVFIS